MSESDGESGAESDIESEHRSIMISLFDRVDERVLLRLFGSGENGDDDRGSVDDDRGSVDDGGSGDGE
jgi:hypothetical protein